MHTFLRVFVSLSVLMCFVSCSKTSSLESRGNSAYSKAKSATGEQQRMLEKEAYVYYLKAIKSYSDKSKISPTLKSRFAETTIRRGMLILNEAHSDMDALHLFVRDIDSVGIDALPGELKQQYGEFIARMADSLNAKGKLWDAITMFDKSIKIAPNPSAFSEKKAGIVKGFVDQNIELSKMSFDEGKSQKSANELILAEYYAKLALFFDSTNAEAQTLLSNARKENINAYSAYTAVVEQKPDTAIYNAVNNLDILLAIPSKEISGSGVKLKVNMYNYSYNPLRLWAKNFSIVDANGNKYQALASSKVEPEILDQQHETTKLVLSFPKTAAQVKKLVYEYEDHYSEKNFF